MKALLDENLPRSLVRLLAPEIEAQTVQENGWSGRKNGDLLLRLMNLIYSSLPTKASRISRIWTI